VVQQEVESPKKGLKQQQVYIIEGVKHRMGLENSGGALLKA
jgi:hypothetical protein